MGNGDELEVPVVQAECVKYVCRRMVSLTPPGPFESRTPRHNGSNAAGLQPSEVGAFFFRKGGHRSCASDLIRELPSRTRDEILGRDADALHRTAHLRPDLLQPRSAVRPVAPGFAMAPHSSGPRRAAPADTPGP